ncbi:hypothetical protein VL3_2622 [Saccharomyces cerevisiae VL3]|nr:hypothetical protein VL3_2622 [Saccharomyces cerevisiae VL3]
MLSDNSKDMQFLVVNCSKRSPYAFSPLLLYFPAVFTELWKKIHFFRVAFLMVSPPCFPSKITKKKKKKKKVKEKGSRKNKVMIEYLGLIEEKVRKASVQSAIQFET